VSGGQLLRARYDVVPMPIPRRTFCTCAPQSEHLMMLLLLMMS
jgi:hypothetical protein